MLLQGPSGAGKTMSALLVAHGLTGGNWSKVAVIDTERSADLYADLGAYNVLQLGAPFTPERYLQALDACEQAGMEVVVLDSISPCWEHLLDYHASLPGNSFSNWSKVTPRHNALVEGITRSPLHVIACARSKTEYVLADRNGKQVPEKVGMKPIQRDGIDYEFTLVFELDLKHYATATKDRTRLFMDQPPSKLTPQVGEKLLKWCQTGSVARPATAEDVQALIRQCHTMALLTELYRLLTPEQQQAHKPAFQQQKQRLLAVPFVQPTFSQTHSDHGNQPHAA
ncbi:AAA family ATPase [Hymenobacter busanensis]|nr:AAA family ATPase [Hymenobacter busanensis]